MLHGHPIMMTIATQAGYSKWANFTSASLKNLKWLDNLLIEIGLPTTISHLYQDNLSASNVIMKQTKKKQLK